MNKIKNSRFYVWLTKLVPDYAAWPLIICVTFNMLVYEGSRMISTGKSDGYYNLTTPLDELIPVVPWWTVIYFGCYIFWICNYIMISRIGKAHCYRFLLADFMGKCICALFFIFFPTTNIRPVLEDGGIFNQLLNFLYSIDAADNLFPSIHCLVSWYCYAGLRRSDKVKKSYKRLSLVFVILICISTLTTKQHVIVDVAAGIALAEITWQIALHTKGYKVYSLFEKKPKKVKKRQRVQV